ncbi:hypothetical protein Rxycam_03032 [Rubrobacter xylanophilus DSM 9941]|nr:hypothetical protein Rxycam_03032 [Rubrobacter xylanophilus DSM 9941]
MIPASLLRRLLSRLSGREERSGGGSRSSFLLSDEELTRIGTEEDPLRDYEEAAARSLEALRTEQGGDTERAVRLYEELVASGFVESRPYERLADIYERRRHYQEALRVTESYLRLARSGRMPRGAQRSANRKLAAFEARAERYRTLSGRGGEPYSR